MASGPHGSTAPAPSRSYHVTVGVFEGPFDLLLHLIARRKLDIYEVPLADITDEYLEVLRGLDVVDLEPATDFLVIAATLLELKAARLLPGEEGDVDEGVLEARDLLYARLLEYRTFKRAAAWLRGRLAAHADYVPRTAGLDEHLAALHPPVELAISGADLARIAARAFADARMQHVDLTHVQPARLTVREAAASVLDELEASSGRLSFAELTAGCRHVAEVVAHFLAVLELYKHGHVDLEQATHLGVLTVVGTRLGSGAEEDEYDG